MKIKQFLSLFIAAAIAVSAFSVSAYNKESKNVLTSDILKEFILSGAEKNNIQSIETLIPILYEETVKYLESEKGKKDLIETISRNIPLTYDTFTVGKPFVMPTYRNGDKSIQIDEKSKVFPYFGIYSGDRLVGIVKVGYYYKNTPKYNEYPYPKCLRFTPITANYDDELYIFDYSPYYLNIEPGEVRAGTTERIYAIDKSNSVHYIFGHINDLSEMTDLKYSDFSKFDPVSISDDSPKIDVSGISYSWYITDGKKYLTREDNGYSLKPKSENNERQLFEVSPTEDCGYKLKNLHNGKYVSVNGNTELNAMYYVSEIGFMENNCKDIRKDIRMTIGTDNKCLTVKNGKLRISEFDSRSYPNENNYWFFERCD